jgi:hypothetical protein
MNEMNRKAANATKRRFVGKRFWRKKTAREIWDLAPKLAVQEAFFSQG